MEFQINDKDMKEKPLAYLIVGVLILVAGITMIIFRGFFLYVLMVAVGVALALDGATLLRGIGKWQLNKRTETLMTAKGIGLILLGICTIVFPFVIADALSVLFTIIGIVLCISACISLYNAWDFKKRNATVEHTRFLWEAGVSLGLAIILFIGPQAIAGVAVIIIGILVALAGAVIAVTCIGEMLK